MVCGGLEIIPFPRYDAGNLIILRRTDWLEHERETGLKEEEEEEELPVFI